MGSWGYQPGVYVPLKALSSHLPIYFNIMEFEQLVYNITLLSVSGMEPA